ncbi:hypothetical protein EJ05DRAFT_475608, partial [Pseudovirgaria hyperparasitica]
MSTSLNPSMSISKHPLNMVGTTINPITTTTITTTPTAAQTQAAKAAQAKMHRRSRTGCFTCRLRRKKCDEGKPGCRACNHLGLKCEYKRPVWWSNNEQRRHQKELIKNIIKRTKLAEKTSQPVAPPCSSTHSPPSLCHSLPASDGYSDGGAAHTRAASVDSQLSLDYDHNSSINHHHHHHQPHFHHVQSPEYYDSTSMLPPPPPMYAPSSYGHHHHPFPPCVPYEVDIKTERQTFVNDVPTRRDSSISTFSTYQAPGSTSSHSDSWIQQDYFESRRESFAEEPIDFHYFDFTQGQPPLTPSHPAVVIQVEDEDQYLLDHFINNVIGLIFPILEVNQHGSARSDVILPALQSNKCYLHCCLSIAALHLKGLRAGSGTENDDSIDQDIMRHRFATVSELCDALNRDVDHAQILEATLSMIFFQCMVGRPDDSLPDIPWHQHYQAVTNLLNKLELPAQLVAMNNTNTHQPPFNMTLAAWIDILGATMLARTPVFADTYREKLIADAPSGLAELMGCDDRVMYLISEIACLEALKADGMDDVTLCSHIKLLGDQISLTETTSSSSTASTSALSSPYSPTGAIRPKHLSRAITAVFRLAARIALCGLIPDIDRTSASITSLVSALVDAMAFIPVAFDKCLAWPLLVAGSVALPDSAFRGMFAARAARMGEEGVVGGAEGSFGRVGILLAEVWAEADADCGVGGVGGGSVHWRDVMRRKGWDCLL